MKCMKALIFKDQSNKNTAGRLGKSSVDYMAYKEYLPKRGTAVSANVPVIFLHGLFRGKETWDECGQSIADRTNSKVYSLDARNHGDSKWTDTMDYDSMADDVSQFMDNMEIPKATIVGHGMGGKTGMVLALKYPQKIQSLALEDTSLNSHMKSREQLMRLIEKYGEILDYITPNIGLREAQKMAVSGMVVRHYYYIIKRRKNTPRRWDGSDLPLKKKPSGGFEWNINFKSIAENMVSEPWNKNGVYEGPVLVIYGTHSINNVLDERVEFLKQFPRAVYEPIEEGVDYALHIEYPDMFTHLVCDFIMKQRN